MTLVISLTQGTCFYELFKGLLPQLFGQIGGCVRVVTLQRHSLAGIELKQRFKKNQTMEIVRSMQQRQQKTPIPAGLFSLFHHHNAHTPVLAPAFGCIVRGNRLIFSLTLGVHPLLGQAGF
jgi:hypothetical protein